MDAACTLILERLGAIVVPSQNSYFLACCHLVCAGRTLNRHRENFLETGLSS